MRLYRTFFIFILICGFTSHEEVHSVEKRAKTAFIKDRSRLNDMSNNSDIIIVASTGFSGSTLLFNTVHKFIDSSIYLIKTHCLPPKSDFKGKILFIYSNPDISAESFLHRSLKDPGFARTHFSHVETADRDWFGKIKSTGNQDLTNNLLTHDALGCGKHLALWLHEGTTPCYIHDAQILAIKYEHLWDQETIAAINEFLLLKDLNFPLWRQRGYQWSSLTELEKSIRQAYNLGTVEAPKYAAYEYARAIWEAAPPFQFLRIK